MLQTPTPSIIHSYIKVEFTLIIESDGYAGISLYRLEQLVQVQQNLMCSRDETILDCDLHMLDLLPKLKVSQIAKISINSMLIIPLTTPDKREEKGSERAIRPTTRNLRPLLKQ